MNKKELASTAVVVLAQKRVAVHLTSEISSVLNDPGYLGANPGTLSKAIWNSTYRATAYANFHGFTKVKENTTAIELTM